MGGKSRKGNRVSKKLIEHLLREGSGPSSTSEQGKLKALKKRGKFNRSCSPKKSTPEEGAGGFGFGEWGGSHE
jgi:hypothetical protein